MLSLASRLQGISGIDRVFLVKWGAGQITCRVHP